MGNCQAAEAATVIVLHPGGKIERVCYSTTAGDVMVSNPGHYVAVVLATSSSPPKRHLKLLRPEETLRLGDVYRLVSSQEVMKGVGSKKHVKLRRLLLAQQMKESCRESGLDADGNTPAEKEEQKKEREEDAAVGEGHAAGAGGGGTSTRRRQWRPALQSIAEVGTSY